MVVPLDSVPGASACPIGEDTRRRPPSTSDLGAQTVRASTVGGHDVATGKTCHHIGHFSHTSPAGTPPTHRPRPSESPRPAPPMHQTRAALKAKVRKSSDLRKRIKPDRVALGPPGIRPEVRVHATVLAGLFER